jgi:exosortase family protein XrtF
VKDLKPALRFLTIFLVLYLGLNVLYGIWISSYGTEADPATWAVTRQTSAILNLLGEQTTTLSSPGKASVSILVGMRSALSVYEGCNGINVMIVFVAFIFAFGGAVWKMSWFVPLGIVMIYMVNLIRVLGLFYVAEHLQEYFYYIHKYAFTAFIYVFVLILWWWWVEKISSLSLRDLLKTDEK